MKISSFFLILACVSLIIVLPIIAQDELSQGLAPQLDRNNSGVFVLTSNNPSLWNGRAYGYNANGSIIPKGPFKFYLNNPGQMISLASDPLSANFICAASFDNYGTWWGVRYGNHSLVKIDTTSGAIIHVQYIQNVSYIAGIACDPTTNIMYAIDYGNPYTRFGTINLTSGIFTQIGNPVNGMFIDLACSNSGQLYSINITDDKFYSVNKTTGVFSVIGALGIDANYAQGMSWESSIDSCYWASYTSFGELRRINHTTGMSFLIGALNCEVDGLAIPRICPIISHIPLPNTEDLTGPYLVSCIIHTASAPLEPNSTKLYWSRNSATVFDSVIMTNLSSNIWSASITGNGVPSIYRYYIKTIDTLGGIGILPFGAPVNIFSFAASADTIKPIIFHTTLNNLSLSFWPAEISAIVTDNIGIDSVWVEWYKNSTSNGIRHFKLINTADSNFTASFNSVISDINVEDSIFYKIFARDNSSNHNTDSTALRSFQILSSAFSYIDSGITGTDHPYRAAYSDSRTQMLYLASEILYGGGTKGYITRIGFTVQSLGLNSTMKNFSIKMHTTSSMTLYQLITTGFTEVLFLSSYAPNDTGLQILDLNTPYYWDGIGNLLIEICFDGEYISGQTNYLVASTSRSGKTAHYAYSEGNGCTMVGGGPRSLRPNICLVLSPLCVKLATPSNNSTFQPKNLTFKWYKAFEDTRIPKGLNQLKNFQKDIKLEVVTNYLFELATDSIFSNIVQKDSLLTDTFKTVTNLSNVTNYWWRIKAKNQNGWHDYSNVSKFSTIFATPSLIFPQNLAQNINLTPTLDWNDVSGVTGYGLQISSDTLFNTIIYSDTNSINSYFSVLAGMLSLNTDYYWRVRGRNNAVFSEYSQIFKFTTYSNSLSMWYWQNPVPQGNPINGLYFLNTSTGWAVGDGGEILKTTNGGQSWLSKSLNIPYSLSSVHFVNINTGWAVGQNGTVLISTNSGYNWTIKNLNTNNYLNHIKFIDNNTGWIIGNNSTLYKTTDGGNSWITKSYNPIVNFMSLSFIDNNIGWICGSGNTIIRTLDGGNTWTQQNIGSGIQFNSICFPDVYTGWVVGSSMILKTTNGGVNWSGQTSGKYTLHRNVNMINTNTGFIVGNDGKVLKTTNGGINWLVQTSNTSNTINTQFHLDLNTGYFAGINAISKTSNGGNTWTSLIQGTIQTLNSVTFVNEYTGWVSGNTGIVINTTTGGNQWNIQNTGITNDLNSGFFINNNTGWSIGSAGTIIKTTNMGVNWISQVSGTTSNLYSIFFATDSIGWISGNGIILNTNLSGTFWTTQYTNASYPIYSLYFLNKNIGWACGGNGYVYRTTNSGVNWINQVTNSTDVHNSIKFKDANTGWIVGNAGKIYVSTNSGLNWTSQISGVSNNLKSISITDTANVLTVGTGGLILKTTNLGINWVIESSPTANDLKSIFFANSGTGWTVGSNGTVLKTNSTTPAAPISLIYPNGGENISSGTECNIAWTSFGVTDLSIGYTTNNGVSWNTIISSIPAITGNYNWNIPIGISSINCRIRLSNVADPFISDISNNVFRIYTLPSVTILHSPANGSLGLNIPVNLVWNKSAYALTYNIIIATDSIFSNVILNDSNYIDTVKTIYDLNNYTFYYWKVRAKNYDGYSNFSDTWKFKTLGQANPIILSQPENYSIEQPINISFKWYKATEQRLLPSNKISNSAFITDYSYPSKIFNKNKSKEGTDIITNYWFELAIDSLFMNLVFIDSSLTDTTIIVDSLLYNKNYFWRVKAKNETGWNNFSPYWKFTTLVITPPNNSTNISLTPLMGWGNISGTTSYRLQVSTDSTFLINQLDTSGIISTSLTIPSGILSGFTKYYWRVNSIGVRNIKSWSPVYNFTTQVPIPSSPSLIFPLNNSIGNHLNLSLIWNKPKYSEKYNLVLAIDYGFTNVIINDTTLIDSVKSLTNLTPLTKYYWKVRAKNISGWGDYSNIYNFKTIGSPTQVILSEPINNSINQFVNITFRWFKAFDQVLQKNKNEKSNINTQKVKNKEAITDILVSNYLFELATDSLFGNIIQRDSSLTDTSKLVTGLSNISTYWWRVKAKNEIGWAEYSNVWKFTTIVPVPAAPVLALPQNNSVDISLTPLLDWNEVQYASSYSIQISTNSGFTTTVVDTSTIIPSQFTVPSGKLSTLTTYYWRVNATNINGTGSYSTIWNFTTIPSLPSAPLLSQPLNNAVNQQTTLTFKWYKSVETLDFISKGKDKVNIGGAISDENPDEYTISKYWFEYSTDSTFATLIGRDTTLTDTTKIISGLNNLTKYYWRVKAKNQVGWGIFSSVWNFTTIIPLPSAPVLISPANNSLSVSLTPLLDWNDVQYASSYRIQMSTDSLFGTTLWDTSSVIPSQVIVPIGKLTGLTKYYWRVNATNIAGTGSWSAVWNFRTLQNLSINLKVYLEGFWDGSSQVVDTAKIYLANSTSPFAFADSATVIISSTGTANPIFTKTANGSYYIVVMHRNHLETWSKLPQAFITGAPVSYDFTTAANKAYGDNMKLSNGAWVLYAGDANQDGAVDALDVGIFITQFGNLGYLSCDFNGDGSVDALDVMIFIGDFGMTKAMPTLDNLPFDRRTKEQIMEEIKSKFGYMLNKENNNSQ